MTTPDIEGLDQLERAVLDEDVSLATALRRFLLLAGYAHQEELRAWALKQSEGYEVDEEVPRFRGRSNARDNAGAQRPWPATIRRYPADQPVSASSVGT
ncbi:AbiTii domain-containing protein [Streptomyces lydicus]|uniref:AbiTii domain-containing protein n=1 Tax=Streptomyces lydicus TaxID=47763 RepID=UPI00131E5AA7